MICGGWHCDIVGVGASYEKETSSSTSPSLISAPAQLLECGEEDNRTEIHRRTGQCLLGAWGLIITSS